MTVSTAKRPTIEQIKQAYQAAGYRFFDEGDYNLNLVGIRSAESRSNEFNDWFGVAFYTQGQPHLFWFSATTDPGTYWREEPAHIDGTAIVKPGQYPGLWKLGQHQGKYDALVQAAPVTVYRDNNRDQALDISGEAQQGHYGINCHRARAYGVSKRVDRWSAGCQVLASAVDFALLMNLCRQARNRYGNGFTYTLFDEAQLWNL
ncbi:MAG: hypothetical protein ACRBBW_20355 [Cellvibrionaceae bacterium]